MQNNTVETRTDTNLPQWMLKENEYTSQKDQNGYFTKSILNFFKLFRHFHLNKVDSFSNISTASICNNLILTIGLIILTSLSKNIFFIGTVSAFLLVITGLKPIEILKSVIFTGITAAFFTAIIMLPSFLIYKTNTIFIITVKVFISTGLITLFAKSSPWNKITAAFRFFHIPDFLIFIIDLTLHYILILGNIAFDMLQALKLRTIGKNQNKQKSFSGITGTLFLKSVELSKETQQAMECRLFNGTYKSSKQKIKPADFVPLLILILYIGFYVYTYIKGVKK